MSSTTYVTNKNIEFLAKTYLAINAMNSSGIKISHSGTSTHPFIIEGLDENSANFPMLFNGVSSTTDNYSLIVKSDIQSDVVNTGDKVFLYYHKFANTDHSAPEDDDFGELYFTVGTLSNPTEIGDLDLSTEVEDVSENGTLGVISSGTLTSIYGDYVPLILSVSGASS